MPIEKRWLAAGLVLALAHLVWLTGIALFDEGRLVSDWMGTSVWIIIVAIPALLALAGWERPRFRAWASWVSVPLIFISLAGATLPLALPAVCYWVAYEKAEGSKAS